MCVCVCLQLAALQGFSAARKDLHREQKKEFILKSGFLIFLFVTLPGSTDSDKYVQNVLVHIGLKKEQCNDGSAYMWVAI